MKTEMILMIVEMTIIDSNEVTVMTSSND